MSPLSFTRTMKLRIDPVAPDRVIFISYPDGRSEIVCPPHLEWAARELLARHGFRFVTSDPGITPPRLTA